MYTEEASAEYPCIAVLEKVSEILNILT